MKRWLWGIFLLLLVACGSSSPSVKPIVSVITPADGVRVYVGESLTIYVSAAANSAIDRIEARQDGVVIAAQKNTAQTPLFTTRIQYAPNKVGQSAIVLTAFDASGVASEAVALRVIADATTAAQPTAATAPAQPNTIGATESNCKLNSAFVVDVTIPDDTVIKGGDTFIKTWKLKNTSACDWGKDVQVVFVGGEKMNALEFAPVLPTIKNGEIDVSMAFIAPRDSGKYTSIWQLRLANGTIFGEKFYVTIKVN